MLKISLPIVSAQVVKQDEEKRVEQPKLEKRPEVLRGETYKLTNHYKGYNLYLTVNYNNSKPYETFIDGSHTDHTEWVKALSRLMSAMLRSHDNTFDLEFIGRELIKVHSAEGYHTGGKHGYMAGVVQHIGKTLLRIHKSGRSVEDTLMPEPEHEEPAPRGATCPKCGGEVVKLDGCDTCRDCGDSKCG